MGTYETNPITIGRVYRGIQKIKFMFYYVDDYNDHGWPDVWTSEEQVLIHWES